MWNEAMATRTSQSTVRFGSTFLLQGFDAPQPAGEYRVERDEETIEGSSWLGWRCVATFIYLPAIGVVRSTQQLLQVDPAELQAALEEDHDDNR